jgi:hypothetical protein
LDLLALLMAPLAFTFFDQGREEDPTKFDSMEVLESLRRYADRLTVFCQAGRTVVPRAQYPQLAFLEDSVVECQLPDGGSLHAKVWVLRFVREREPVRLRALCLSRNLVFAQSWDTVLSLDGVVEDRQRAIGDSRPLAEFVEALSQFAVRLPLSSAERLSALADEVRRTRFEPPEGFTGFKLWPIGLPGRRAKLPFQEVGKRFLIVSPFLTQSRIEELANLSDETTLVSTAQELSKLTRRVDGIRHYYVLNDRALSEVDSSDDVTPMSMAEAVQLRDLHAKLYVTESGGQARLWTGSANATASGFDRNVEFLVELTGPKRLFGLDTLLEPTGDSVRFINLLTPADELVASGEPYADEQALDELLDDVRRQLAAAALELHASQHESSYDVEIWCPKTSALAFPPGVAVECWPSSVASQSAVPVSPGPGGRAIASFSCLTGPALTTFTAFRVSASLNGLSQETRFVLNLPLLGASQDRKAAVLRAMLSDERRLVRFLMLMLAGEGLPVPGFSDNVEADFTSSAGNRDGFSPNGLFEMLLRALDEAPTRLDHLDSLLRELKTGAAAVPLPAGFDAIWEPIRALRRASELRP